MKAETKAYQDFQNAVRMAKQVPLPRILSQLGFEVKERAKGYLKYSVRPERTPSFTVYHDTNRWKDYGDGTHGDGIDLVRQQKGLDFKAAVQWITGQTFPEPEPDKSFSPNGSFTAKPLTSGVTIKKVKDLENRALLDYLYERKIPERIARKYLKEAYYTVKAGQKKPYFSLAFRNDKGGYELRNSIVKLSVSPKAPTTFQHRNNLEWSVFEGFMDFLSVLAYFRTDTFPTNVVVLNSVSELERAFEIIPEKATVWAYVDNDKAGDKAFTRLQDRYNVKDCTVLYSGFTDANEWLKSNPIQNYQYCYPLSPFPRPAKQEPNFEELLGDKETGRTAAEWLSEHWIAETETDINTVLTTVLAGIMDEHGLGEANLFDNGEFLEILKQSFDLANDRAGYQLIDYSELFPDQSG